MATDKKVRINFETSANTKPVEELQKELDQLRKDLLLSEGSVNSLRKAMADRPSASYKAALEEEEAILKATTDQIQALEKTLELRKDNTGEAKRLADVEAARAKQAKEDVKEVQRRRSEREANEVSASRATQARIAGAAAGAVAVGAAVQNAAARVNELIERYREVDAEGAKQFDEMQSRLKVITSPLESFIEWATDGSSEAITNLQKSIEEGVRTRGVLVKMIQDVGNEEIRALEEQAATIDRAAKVLQAARQADSAENRLSDTRAVAGGASPNQVRADRSASDLRAAAVQMDEDLAGLQNKVDTARAKAADIQNEINLMTEQFGSNAPELPKLREDLKAQTAEFYKFAEDLTTQQQVNTERMRELSAKTSQEIESALTAFAEETNKREVDVLRKIVESVKPSDTNNEEIKRIVTQAIKDGTVSEIEINDLAAAAKIDREAAKAAILQALQAGSISDEEVAKMVGEFRSSQQRALDTIRLSYSDGVITQEEAQRNVAEIRVLMQSTSATQTKIRDLLLVGQNIMEIHTREIQDLYEKYSYVARDLLSIRR